MSQPKDTDAPKPTDAQLEAKEQPPPKKRRRKRRIVIIVLLLMFVMLLAAVGLAPTAASSRWARDRIVGMVNDRIAGNVAVNQISLSWFGDCRISGVTVNDAQRREVLSFADAQLPKGVWRLIRAGMNLGEIRIDGAQLTAYLDADNNLSLSKALTPTVASSDSVDSTVSESTSLPDVTVILRDAKITVVRPDNRRLDVSAINLAAQVNPAGDVTADLSATLPNQTVISTQLEASKLATFLAGESLDPLKLNAKATSKSDGEIDLAGITDVLLEPGQVNGALDLDLDIQIENGVVTSDIKTSAKQLAWAGVGRAQVQPIDVKLIASAQSDGDKSTADVNLESTAGNVSAKLQGSLQNLSVDGAALLEALLAGSSIDLPDVSADITGRLDLARIARAVPALLKVRDDTTVTGGTVDIASLVLRGGESPSAKLALSATDVTAQASGQTVTWQPIHLNADIGADEQQRLRLNSANVESGFATLTASGSPQQSRVTVDADLAGFQDQVGKVFDLGVQRLSGKLQAAISLDRRDDQNLNVDLDATVAGLEVINGDRSLRVNNAKIAHQSHLTLKDNRIARIKTDQTTLSFDQSIVASAVGWYEPHQNAYEGSIDLPRVDTQYLGRVLASLGVDQLTGQRGVLQLRAQINGSGGRFSSSGDASAASMEVDGKKLTDTLQLTWSQLAFDPDGGAIAADKVKLDSDAGDIVALGVNVSTASPFTASGKVNAKTDLARAMLILQSLTGTDPPPVSGLLTLDADCETSANKVTLKGSGNIDRLVLGDLPPENEPVAFAFDAVVNNKLQKVRLKQAQLSAAPFSIDLVGDVTDYSNLAQVDLRGKYQLRLKRLTDWLHQVAPNTRDIFSVVGAQRGVIAASGPANRSDVTPCYRDLTAMMETGFRSAQVYGIPLGATKLEPRLEGGVIRLPMTTIEAAEGRINIGGELDLVGEVTVSLPQRIDLLDKIKVTPQLAKHVLTRFNPIFGQATKIRGRINLMTRDVTIPLGPSMTTGGSGSGRLDLRGFRIKPGGLLAELLHFGGFAQEEMVTVKVKGADFVIKEGRLRYDDFTMIFGDGLFDLKFYGSVGFDDTLDLVVSIPIRENLLRRLKVSGPVVQYASLLNDARVDIPIVGTRENPKMDLAKVNINNLLESALKRKGEDIKSGKGLEDLLNVIPGLDEEKPDSKKKNKPGRRKKRKQKP